MPRFLFCFSTYYVILLYGDNMESKEKKKKNKILILVIIGLIILGVILFIFYPYGTFVKDKKITEISYFDYHFNPGWGQNKIYTITCSDNDSCTANIRVDNKDHNNINIDKRNMTKLIDILNKYHVGSWDNFNKKREGWYDLDGFSLNITIQNEERIEAKGYGYFPRNYEKLSQSLDEFFLDLI